MGGDDRLAEILWDWRERRDSGEYVDPEDVIAGLRHVRDAAPRPRPRPEGKRVWATLTRGLKDVIADTFDEAQDRDLGQ